MGEGRAVTIRGQLPRRHRIPQAAGEQRLPVEEDLLEAQAQLGGELHHLLTQIAHKAAPLERKPGHAPAGAVDEGNKTGQGGQALILQIARQLAAEVVVIGIHDRQSEVVLGGEVVIEGALGDPGRLQHPLDGGGGDALFGQQLHAPADQQIPGVGIGVPVLGRAAARAAGQGVIGLHGDY